MNKTRAIRKDAKIIQKIAKVQNDMYNLLDELESMTGEAITWEGACMLASGWSLKEVIEMEKNK